MMSHSIHTSSGLTQGSALKPTIVFYDGACPICQKEIHHYRKLKSLKPIDWQDISGHCPMLEQYGIDKEEAMKRFHVIADNGVISQGAEAFLALWRALPGYRHLANIIEFCHLQGLLEWAYRGFARRRFRQACLRNDKRCRTDTGQ